MKNKNIFDEEIRRELRDILTPALTERTGYLRDAYKGTLDDRAKRHIKEGDPIIKILSSQIKGMIGLAQFALADEGNDTGQDLSVLLDQANAELKKFEERMNDA